MVGRFGARRAPIVRRCWTKSALQLYVSAGAAALLGLYAFTMPKCPPARATGKRSIVSALGLDAFVLFRHTQMLVFFTFAVLLGAALQITNAFGSAFLADFKTLSQRLHFTHRTSVFRAAAARGDALNKPENRRCKVW